MSIKSKYYKLTKDEFAQYLDSLKNAPGTRFFMEQSPHPYFYCMLPETYQALMKLNRARIEFDKVMDEFSEFGRRQLVQSFLIDEIKATNTIESIASTRHDIFSIINKVKSAENKKIVSIGNAYVLLLQTAGDPVCRPEDVRIIYDLLMENAIDGKDMPDGEFFRKGPVYITDGMRKIHTGIEGEASINRRWRIFWASTTRSRRYSKK